VHSIIYIFSIFLFFSGITSSALAQGLQGTGLEISVTGDMLYAQGLNRTSKADDKVTMRGAEFMLYAPIDYQFDGVLTAAAHDENGQSVFELHELFMSTSRIVPRSNIRFGQFFLPIGRINRFHQHDWPFTTAPKVHRTFFDNEGVFDTGLEYNYLLPTEFNLNLTFGVTSGYKYGHSHTQGSKPRTPTHFARFSNFLPFNTTNGLESGLNYLGRTDAQGNEFKIIGLDLTAKWRQARLVSHLIQSEFWYRNDKKINQNDTEQVGLYIYNEFATGQQSSVGYRLDSFKNLSKVNAITLKKINNIHYGNTFQATYASTEFAKIRATISHEFEIEEGQTTEKDTRFTLQFVFIIGSHPAHDF